MAQEVTDHVVTLGRTTLDNIHALIGELDALSAAYKQRLAKATKLERRELADPLPGIHEYVTSVKGTGNSVQRVLKAREGIKVGDSEADDQAREERDKKDTAIIQGCGLNPHQEQWDAIKRTHGLMAFRRRFSGHSAKLGTTVDAVVENGTEWVKVSVVTEKKLIYQMAQEGWNPDDSTDEDSDASDGENTGIGIVKTASQLVKAARSNRCNTRIPRVRLVLPNLREGRIEAVDKLLNRIRCMGVSKRQEGNVEILVDCSNSKFLETPIPPLEKAFANMFRDTNLDRLTPTVNLELTILLSLASDIAHAVVEPKEWYSMQTLSHLEDEIHAPGERLQVVYNALRGRRLECTYEVAREFCNIVDDLGTDTTKARAAIMFGWRDIHEGLQILRHAQSQPLNGRGDENIAIGAPSARTEPENQLDEWRKLSIYPVPDDIRFPILMIGEDKFDDKQYSKLIEAGKLPPAASKVWEKLDRPYNRSCHLWGWMQDITTVSANCLNTRLVDATVDKERISALEVGPRLYLSALAISLNTAKPCPTDKWNEIKDAKHERKDARTKEAKSMKAAGIWGPSMGVPVKWDQKQLRKQNSRQRKEAVDSSNASQRSSSTEE
ncbi:hypothetical protein KVR01_009806 [Diaporthe batatas]|uniref:uncharacterized protein n=1 Tax=Diaporthe batatas TaxID=748121 RepID=UPI001D0519D2|nr:uncharacterized protein KVR01_009806 [Diaporthe batatas]KAG8160270.1 hypothetical protein KVR01_009806 [Diaporthe batatas]